MVNEKKPSIYVDRGTIGSSEELDEYGVWVKSEPQDLSSVNLKIHEAQDLSGGVSAAADSDLDFPEINDLPDFDTLQPDNIAGASDTIALKDDFDLPEMEIEEKSSTDTYNFGDFKDQDASAESSDDFLELPDIEDSSDDELENFGDKGDEGFTEVSMDDFIGTLDSELDETAEDQLDIASSEPVSPQEESVREDTGFLASGKDEVIETHSSSYSTERVTAKDISASSDLSTQLLMKIAEELSSIRSELSSLKKDFSGLKASSPKEEEGEKDFFGEEDDEKIALTGDELNNILNTADFTEEAGSDATVELSEDLDIQEAEDISSSGPFLESSGEEIGLDSFPKGSEIDIPEIESAEQITEDLQSEKKAPDAAGLVKLDELTLGLSMDDLSLEEFGDEPAAEAAQEFDSAEMDSLGIVSAEQDLTTEDDAENFSISLDDESFSLDDESAEESADVLDLESPDLEAVDLQAGEEILPDFAAEESDELKQLRENGAEPITFAPAPEDTAYLENDPLVEEPLTEEPLGESLPEEADFGAEDFSTADLETEISADTLDLSDAVIDEPDLSMDIQDNPLEEPSLEDISINLDLSDLGSEEIEPVAETIDIEPPEDESGIEDDPVLIPEAFVEEADDSEAPIEESEDETLSIADLDVLDMVEASPAEEPEEIPDFKNEKEAKSGGAIPTNLQRELKTVLSYLDQLLESLPDEKIEEFARSDYYDTYKKLFKDLGLV